MAKATLLWILLLAMIMLCSGWVSLWLLKPTNFWTKKWRVAEDKANATLLGYSGLNFAVYTFPVIVVAIIGHIYLHFKPNELRRRQVRRANAVFSSPLVLNSFLGILSGLEVLAACLFIMFLTWTFYVRISKDMRKLMPVKTLKLRIWQLKYLRVATRFGLLAEACLALLLLPVLRGLSLFQIIGIQFEASVRYHAWLGTAMVLFATIHGASTLFIWGVSDYIQEEIWKWQKTGRIYLAGELALVTMLVLWLTSLPQVRRKRFEIFYYTHHLYMIFLVFFLFHVGDRHFYMVFSGIFLFAIDKLLRIIQSRSKACILSARVFPCRGLELTLPKDPRLKYTPTSVVYVKIPHISNLQWHPFSLTSSSSMNDYTMTLLTKCKGGWTGSLYKMIAQELDSDDYDMRCIPVAIEGPYGPFSLALLRYNNLLLVAGGIGITPFLSILQELHFIQTGSRCTVPTSITLIYAVKKSDEICMLSSISPLLVSSPSKRWHVKLKLFVTQEEDSGATVMELLNNSSQIRTINFCTPDSYFPVHGVENPLWLAAFAGLSAFVFLIFIVFFNHVFVHSSTSKRVVPSEKVLKVKTLSSVSDLLVMVSFVLAITCSSVVAIVIRWRKLKKDTPSFSHKQEKSTELNSMETTGDVAENHEIYFAGRPNFKDIFSEFAKDCGGIDIGVVVCGPETMKESVAAMCNQKSRGFLTGSKKKPYFSFQSLDFTL